MRHDWPGNVRELQNRIEHSVIMTPDGSPIAPNTFSLPHPGCAPTANLDTAPANPSPRTGSEGTATPDRPAAPDAEASIADIERAHIHRILLRTGGNRTQAAQILDVSVRTLRNKLSTYRDAGYSEFSAFD